MTTMRIYILDNTGSFRGDGAKGVDVSHHIVCRQLQPSASYIRLRFFSSWAATFICSSSRSRCAFICSMAASGMGRPSSYSMS